MDDFLRRRIEFILNEAKFQSKKDKSITFTMRVLSNYASVGRDGESKSIKELNKCISKAAWEKLKNLNSFNDWLDNLINEHQMPLKQTWQLLLQNSNLLDIESVWNHFKLYPMVTVLKEENIRLNSKGNRSNGDPIQRYKDAEIEIVKLIYSPKDAWKNKSFDLAN
jgi:hypothetical protein